ncbi:uncharacterized protein JN550_002426 [Neoarthrinium moseri]|uniref:uncharacterized protein n=1 Tax=Neoarthrinium moseri TaxID=1658444 RepID=UPI001FDE723D|nr:uncharacterized protein JN550_002426 [Neoarthrinium moseri]KAI1874997.1 hypothetical protein JN550_002426 [Neoarthrinium moseri]
MAVQKPIRCPTNAEGLSGATDPPPGLDVLPAEIHLLISKELTYPDALSLKHTCRYFYTMVDTGIILKATHAATSRAYGMRVAARAGMSGVRDEYMFSSSTAQKSLGKVAADASYA